MDPKPICSKITCCKNAIHNLKFSIPPSNSKDLGEYLSVFRTDIIDAIQKDMNERRLFSARMYMEATLTLERKVAYSDQPHLDRFHITSQAMLITQEELDMFLDNCIDISNSRIDNSEEQVEGSGWAIKDIQSVTFVICQFERGVIGNLGSYKPYPKKIKGARQIYNPKVQENCVLISLASYFYFKGHPKSRLSNVTQKIKKDEEKFWREQVQIGDLSPNIALKDLPKLEELNKVSIYIYNLSKLSDKVYTLHIARKSCKEYEFVPLLLIKDDHICLIRDLKKYYSAFIHPNPPVVFLCHICLTPFKSEKDQQNHTAYCTANSTIIYPEANSKVSFEKICALYPMPYVGFLDLEALNKKSESTDMDNPDILSTQHAIASHFKILNLRTKRVIAEGLDTGMDCVDKMLTSLSKKWDGIYKSHESYRLDMTPEDEKRHEEKTHCDLCECLFSDSNLKVRHHYHYKPTENYSGTLCRYCNLQLVDCHKILPVLVHNLSYDLILILKQASKDFKFTVKKKQGLKFFSGQCKRIKFIDSYNMIKGSLSSLVKEHIKNEGSLYYTKKTISHLSQEAQSLLLDSGKQILPYEYISSLEKLEETVLPPKSEFYNSLQQSHISDEDYAHVKKVWDTCECKTLMDYLKLYLKLDVSFLADVYLQWRETLLQLFHLDCLYFLTLPSYAMEAFYYQTETELDSISDSNLYQLIARNIRGGFCSVGKRHITVNNKDVNEDFRYGEDKSNYLLYIDFNSLYPTCMSKFQLPIGGFRELNKKKLKKFMEQDLSRIDISGNTGYYIHLDIHPVSPDIIEKTDEFPLCLAKKNVKLEDLSDYSRNILREFELKLPKQNQKLIAHHEGLKDHLVSLPLLQFLLSKGLRIDKIHRVYSFRQGKYLKEFIDNNIRIRASETNPLKKNALKLISNAIYGRSLLNQLNYSTHTKVCEEKGSMIKSFSKPTFKKADIISDSRALITYNKAEVEVNSPIYIGFSILDYAKLMMYRFWYDTLVKEYGERVQYVYSDTDSFIINIETDDLTKEIKGPLADHLDLSNFPPNHPLYNNNCKGHLGKLKIETGSEFMTEFVALKPKVYSYTTTNSSESHNTLKGIPKHLRKDLTIDQYKECLYHHKSVRFASNSLRFQQGNMSVVRTEKLALSPFEDKRFYVDCNTSYGYGHPKTRLDVVEMSNTTTIKRKKKKKRFQTTKRKKVDDDDNDDDDDDDDDDIDDDDDDKDDDNNDEDEDIQIS